MTTDTKLATLASIGVSLQQIKSIVTDAINKRKSGGSDKIADDDAIREILFFDYKIFGDKSYFATDGADVMMEYYKQGKINLNDTAIINEDFIGLIRNPDVFTNILKYNMRGYDAEIDNLRRDFNEYANSSDPRKMPMAEWMIHTQTDFFEDFARRGTNTYFILFMKFYVGMWLVSNRVIDTETLNRFAENMSSVGMYPYSKKVVSAMIHLVRECDRLEAYNTILYIFDKFPVYASLTYPLSSKAYQNITHNNNLSDYLYGLDKTTNINNSGLANMYSRFVTTENLVWDVSYGKPSTSGLIASYDNVFRKLTLPINGSSMDDTVSKIYRASHSGYEMLTTSPPIVFATLRDTVIYKKLMDTLPRYQIGQIFKENEPFRYNLPIHPNTARLCFPSEIINSPRLHIWERGDLMFDKLVRDSQHMYRKSVVFDSLIYPYLPQMTLDSNPMVLTDSLSIAEPHFLIIEHIHGKLNNLGIFVKIRPIDYRDPNSDYMRNEYDMGQDEHIKALIINTRANRYHYNSPGNIEDYKPITINISVAEVGAKPDIRVFGNISDPSKPDFEGNYIKITALY